MVVSRSGAMVHPCLKEPVVIPPIRAITKRVAELPSLRYGPIGNSTFRSGPLRVTNAYGYDTIHRGATKSETTHTPQITDLKHSSRHVESVSICRQQRATMVISTPTTGASLNGRRETARCEHALLSVNVQTFLNNASTVNFPITGSRNDASTTFFNSTGPFSESVAVAVSPAPRYRVHPTGRYIRGTLSPTANSEAPAAASPGGTALLRAARDGDDIILKDILRRAVLVGIPNADLNAVDSSGRTALSYIASNGSVELLDQILQLSNLDPNRPDNEGNTPLHFAAQAGQVECLNVLLSRCKGIEIDARNNLGFTSLMKAALQGRNKCAKLLLFAGANPTLRDSGRGLRADQWARFCGRYVCADVIEKHARQRLLERSTSYGNWGVENDIGTRVLLGKVVPVPQIPQPQHGFKSKLKKVFRTSSGPSNSLDHSSSARLVTQLTTAALCASSPVLPSAPSVPPVVKSLIRPLTVPRLQVTLVNNNNDEYQSSNIISNGVSKSSSDIIYDDKEPMTVIKPARTKKRNSIDAIFVDGRAFSTAFVIERILSITNVTLEDCKLLYLFRNLYLRCLV